LEIKHADKHDPPVVCPFCVYFLRRTNNNDLTRPVVASGSERLNVIISINQRHPAFSILASNNMNRTGSNYCNL
jgi:hypothetical protein